MVAEQLLTILVRQSRWATIHNTAHTYTHNSTQTAWEEQSTTMETQPTANGAQQAGGTMAQGPINMHRYKMQPPTFTGEHGAFEEWKYKFQAYMGLMDNKLEWKCKFQAYMGLMDNILPQLQEHAEKPTTIIRDTDLVAAASTTEEINKWKVEAVATTCRQQQAHKGFEFYPQLCVRFSIPLATRSIVYLTKLLKPTFDMKHFEETFSQYGHAFLDSVKIAVIHNETTGPLQQHLQLLAGQSPTHSTVRATIIEYYRPIPAFNKREQESCKEEAWSWKQGTSGMAQQRGGLILETGDFQVETTNITKCEHKSRWRKAPMDISEIEGKGKRIQRKGQIQSRKTRKGLRKIQSRKTRKGLRKIQSRKTRKELRETQRRRKRKWPRRTQRRRKKDTMDMAKVQLDKAILSAWKYNKSRSTKEEGKELKASKHKTGATDEDNKDTQPKKH